MRWCSPVLQELVFAGLFSLIDPPRDGVPEAVATCKRASVKVRQRVLADDTLHGSARVDELPYHPVSRKGVRTYGCALLWRGTVLAGTCTLQSCAERARALLSFLFLAPTPFASLYSR